MNMKPCILSVDDSSTLRKMVRSVVEGLNYDFLEAADGKEALSIISKEYERIALILLDWNMPEMNGIEFLTELKKGSLYKGIPVLMVTTMGEKSNILRAIQAGAANYLLKPFSGDELKTKIRQTLK